MTAPVSPPDVEYPDQDGQPMSDNTLQFRWIVTIQGNIDGMYRDDPNVFVAGDLLWYPVEGQSAIRCAPDTMVVFGRPKGYRGSYMQWLEGGIAPQVVFEVLSPGNRPEAMDRKFEFYDRHGVEEYYLYDPDHPTLSGWNRGDTGLEPIPYRNGWVSPRLGIRFDLSGDEMVIFRPDGQRFLTFVELAEEREAALQQIDAERRRADEERKAREQIQRRADTERIAREDAERRVALLAEKLRSLGIDPNL